MVNGRNPSGGGGNGNGLVGKLLDALENRLVLLFVATVLGTGGSLGVNMVSTETRADPFTGTQASAMEHRLSRRIAQLEYKQVLDDKHRQDAENGYARIRRLEENCAKNMARIEALRDDRRSTP